jgi:signal transduction histidine kinase
MTKEPAPTLHDPTSGDPQEGRREAKRGLSPEELIRFFSVLSHDLKSPIFSIDGFSELLLGDYEEKLDEEGADFLRRIRSSAKTMRRLLDEMSGMIKLLARPDSGGPANMSEIVEQLKLKYSFQIEEGQVRFEAPAELPVVDGDPEKIRVALGHLISNALEFTDRAPGDRLVRLEHEERDGMHHFTVVDNGVGVDPRYLDQIFELGLKLDKSRGEGPGYGLFCASRVAESQGGAVVAESAPGEGSRFTLVLPAGTR